MTVSCPCHKENRHGGRLHAGEVLPVGSPDVACGTGDRSSRRSTAEVASRRAESDLVRLGDGVSLERCAVLILTTFGTYVREFSPF